MNNLQREGKGDSLESECVNEREKEGKLLLLESEYKNVKLWD